MRWGETVRFLSDICVFQLQKSNVRAGAQSTPRFQSGGPSQRPKIFLLEDWPQLQTSEAGKSPLKAAIGPEEWSKFTNYKTDKKKDSSTHITKASLDLSDLTVNVSLWSGGTLVSVRGWWAHHPTTRPHDPRDCPGLGYCLLQWTM